jgi:hypothetical protein
LTLKVAPGQIWTSLALAPNSSTSLTYCCNVYGPEMA